jgi:hypothetical protein
MHTRPKPPKGSQTTLRPSIRVYARNSTWDSRAPSWYARTSSRLQEARPEPGRASVQANLDITKGPCPRGDCTKKPIWRTVPDQRVYDLTLASARRPSSRDHPASIAAAAIGVAVVVAVVRHSCAAAVPPGFRQVVHGWGADWRPFVVSAGSRAREDVRLMSDLYEWLYGSPGTELADRHGPNARLCHRQEGATRKDLGLTGRRLDATSH